MNTLTGGIGDALAGKPMPLPNQNPQAQAEYAQLAQLYGPEMAAILMQQKQQQDPRAQMAAMMQRAQA